MQCRRVRAGESIPREEGSEHIGLRGRLREPAVGDTSQLAAFHSGAQ